MYKLLNHPIVQVMLRVEKKERKILSSTISRLHSTAGLNYLKDSQKLINYLSDVFGLSNIIKEQKEMQLKGYNSAADAIIHYVNNNRLQIRRDRKRVTTILVNNGISVNDGYEAREVLLSMVRFHKILNEKGYAVNDKIFFDFIFCYYIWSNDQLYSPTRYKVIRHFIRAWINLMFDDL